MKIRCIFQDDTRFPTLSVKVAGNKAPPAQAVAVRIARVAVGLDDAEFRTQLDQAGDLQRSALRRPLELAKQLAVVPAAVPANETLTAMLGAQAIDPEDARHEVAARFGIESSTALIAAPKDSEKSDDEKPETEEPSTRGSR